jgi:hypothetical protein
MSKLKVLITIDTEGINIVSRDKLLYEKSLPLIKNIFKTNNIKKATFFVSVFEKYQYGDKLLNYIYDFTKNYEVGLHTHPIWIDKNRLNMHQYSYEEQYKMIKDGKNILENLYNQEILVHRAGAYGLNYNTIKALHDNNIPMDSSMFYVHDNCKIRYSKNQIVKTKEIMEVPVTIFQRQMYDLNNNMIDNRIKKTDINQMFLDEFKEYIEFAIENKLNTLNLFMHSYSFVNYNDKNFTTNHRDINKFNALIEYLNGHKNIEFVNYKDILNQDFDLDNDTIPIIKRIFDKNIKNEDNY